MNIKKILVEIIFKHVNLGGIAADSMDLILEAKLKEIVADTENTFDDSIMALYPMLSEKIKEELEVAIEKLKVKLVESLNEGEEPEATGEEA